MQSQQEYLKILLYTCKLRFFKYPAYYFPVYIFVKLFEQLNFKFRTRKLDFLVVPIPNYYFDFLQDNHLIKSEHSIFINPKIFGYYIYKEDINFLNVSISSKTKKCKQTTETEKVIKNVLSKGAVQKLGVPTKENGETSKMSALYQVFQLKDVPINKVYIKENAFHNLIERYKLIAGKNVYVNLQMLQANQTLPQIAMKANIFLINTPYDIPNSLVDSIMVEYFKKPHLLYRNHTYLINLDENTLGNFLFTEYFQLFTQVKRLFFKCVHLESESNSFEISAIVMKNLTNLHQLTSIKCFVPKQLLDPYFFIKNYPAGLEKYFLELKSSLEAFMMSSNDSKQFMKTEKLHPMFQLIGDRGCGKRRVVRAVAECLGIHLYNAECSDIMTSIASQTETKLLQTLHRGTVCQPVIICLRDFELFGLNNEGLEDVRLVDFFREEVDKLFSKDEFEHPIFIVALINARQPSKSVKLNHLFLESIEFTPPDKTERFQTLFWLHQHERFDRKCWEIHNQKLDNYISLKMDNGCENDINILDKIAELTQGFIFGDLAFLYDKAASRQLEEREEFHLNEIWFDEKLSEMKKLFGESIGTPDIPKVLWEDIGGLAKLKTEVQNSIGLPLKYSHLMGKHMKRSGILLYGPPGTGKTLIAKAVATECNLSFLSVQGPELLNMYVGQSEQNVRDVFARARGAAPCVVFLDELDSLAPNRGVAGDSGGVMDRVVSQLLSEMDGTDSDVHKPVFILAATNRPDLIDPALLRPGRFDRMLYVGPCKTKEDKELVLKAQTKKFNLKRNLNLNQIVDLIPMDVTGADLYSICSNAWLSAVRRQIDQFNLKEVSSEEMIAENVIVNLEDFQSSLKNFVSSLNQTDMEYFNKLQISF